MSQIKGTLEALKDTAIALTNSVPSTANLNTTAGEKTDPEKWLEVIKSSLNELGEVAVKADAGFNSALLGIGAGIAMVGAIGTGIGQGYAVGRGLEAIARNPELFNRLRSTLLLGLAITESSAIYCLVVAIILMFK